MAKNRFEGMGEQMKKAVQKSDLQVSKKSKSTIIEVEIEKIVNPPFHDRYSVNKESIKKLAEDISVHGIINPITIRELENGIYQRISGYRRIEAFKLLGKKEIPAIVYEVTSDIDIFEMMFAENQQREDPSEYDIVIFHLEALCYIIKETDQELKNTISKARKIEQGSLTTKDSDLLKKVDDIKDLLSKTKAFNTINSFYQKMNNILSLDKILIEAIQEKKIYYTIANELNKATKTAKSKEQTENFLIKQIAKNLSLSEAKKAVKEFLIIKNDNDEFFERKGQLKNQLQKIIARIDMFDIIKLEKLEKLLSKIDQNIKV